MTLAAGGLSPPTPALKHMPGRGCGDPCLGPGHRPQPGGEDEEWRGRPCHGDGRGVRAGVCACMRACCERRACVPHVWASWWVWGVPAGTSYPLLPGNCLCLLHLPTSNVQLYVLCLGDPTLVPAVLFLNLFQIFFLYFVCCANYFFRGGIGFLALFKTQNGRLVEVAAPSALTEVDKMHHWTMGSSATQRSVGRLSPGFPSRGGSRSIRSFWTRIGLGSRP